MKAGRGVLIHVVLLGIAGALALHIFTRDEKLASASGQQVPIWTARASDLKSLTYEAENVRVVIESRQDSQGRWYIGTVEKTAPPAPVADAGASSQATSMAPKRETTQFIAAKEGDRIVEAVAPLLAVRPLGKLQANQKAEFGLDKPEGTLRVVFSDKPRTVVVGGLTPNANDRYALVPETGEIFAIPGDFSNSLKVAEQRLLERSLHDFEEGEVTRVKVTRGNASREFVRMPEKKDAWADAASPAKLDETAGNWLAKLDKLTATQYFEQVGVPVLPEYHIARVEYFHDSKPVGFLELTKIPENKGNAGYIAKTEYTRWYAQLMKSSAEQLEQDLNSILK